MSNPLSVAVTGDFSLFEQAVDRFVASVEAKLARLQVRQQRTPTGQFSSVTEAQAAGRNQRVLASIGGSAGALRAQINEASLPPDIKKAFGDRITAAIDQATAAAVGGKYPGTSATILVSSHARALQEAEAKAKAAAEEVQYYERLNKLGAQQVAHAREMRSINQSMQRQFRRQDYIREQAQSAIAAREERVAVEREIRELDRRRPGLTRTQRIQLGLGTQFGRTNAEGLVPTFGQLIEQSAGTIGRYAIAGAGFYALINGVKSVVTEATELQVVMRTLEVQLDTIGQGDQLAGLRDTIFDIATSTGVSAAEIGRLTSQFVGAFVGTTGNQLGGAEQATRIAAELGVIGGIEPEEIFNDLVAGMRAFAEEGTSTAQVTALQNIADISTNVSKISGVPIKELADFLGRIGPIATTAGLSLEEAAAAGAALLQGSAVGGAALGEQFSRILTEFSQSALEIASVVEQVPGLTAGLNAQELADFNAALRDSDPTVLFTLAQGFKNLSTEQQRQIVSTIGSRREGQTLAAILQNSVTAIKALEEAQESEGAAAEEFRKRRETFTQQMAELRQTLLEVGITIAESGLLDFVTDLASAMRILVEPLAEIIGLLEVIPENVRGAAIGFAVLAASVAAFQGRASRLRGGTGGIAGGLGLEAGTSLLSGAALSAGARNIFASRYGRAGLYSLGGAIAAGTIGGAVDGRGGQFLSGGLSGAGLGASLGTIIAPGIGTAIGAGAGFLLGGLSGLGSRPRQIEQTALADLTERQFDQIRREYLEAQRIASGPRVRTSRERIGDREIERVERIDTETAKSQMDRLDKQYPGLKDAIEGGLTNLAQLPENIQQKLEETGAALETALAEFEAGERSLQSLNEIFDREQSGLQRVNSEASRKAAANLARQQNKINSDALKAQFDFAEELFALQGEDDPNQTLERLRALRNTPQIQNDPNARRDVTRQILRAQRELLQSQVNDLDSAAEQLKKLEEGIPVDLEDRASIIEEQLASNSSAFQNFLSQYLVLGAKIPDTLIKDLARAIRDGQDVKAILRSYYEARLADLRALGNSAFFAGDYEGVAAIGDAIETTQKGLDAVGPLQDPTFGTIDVDRVRGSAKEIAGARKRANKDGADTAKELAEARADLMKALIEGDPLAEAQFAQQEADRAFREAENEAGRIRAQAARIRADRQFHEAIHDIYISRIELAQAIAESTGDVVDAAEAALKIAEANLTHANLEGRGEGERNRLQAEVTRATQNLRDVVLNEGIDDFQFAVDMGQKTQGEFVAYLRGLLELPTITKDQRQEISRQIKQLEGALGQDYQFNLPSQLSLPTLYEARRLDQTGGGYQDNRIINIQLVANNAIDGQAALAQIVDALNAPSRYGQSARLY